jgi:hypothetical protein
MELLKKLLRKLVQRLLSFMSHLQVPLPRFGKQLKLI